MAYTFWISRVCRTQQKLSPLDCRRGNAGKFFRTSARRVMSSASSPSCVVVSAIISPTSVRNASRSEEQAYGIPVAVHQVNQYTSITEPEQRAGFRAMAQDFHRCLLNLWSSDGRQLWYSSGARPTGGAIMAALQRANVMPNTEGVALQDHTVGWPTGIRAISTLGCAVCCRARAMRHDPRLWHYLLLGRSP